MPMAAARWSGLPSFCGSPSAPAHAPVRAASSASLATLARRRRFARRVALLQILPHVVDRVTEQFGHACPGELRRALAYRLEDGPVLMQAGVLDFRGALPAQFERALERSADEAAERGEKVIAGPLENAHVKIEIRSDEIARAIPELVHAAIGVGDPIDGGAGMLGRRERRRLRLDHLAKHKEFGDEAFRRRRLQMPRQHLRIEHVPVGLGPNAGADLRPRHDHRLGGEHAIGFSQRRAGDPEPRAHVGRVGQQRTRRVDPAHDLPAEPAGERGVDIALEGLGRAVAPVGALGRRTKGPARAPGRRSQLFGNPRHFPSANLKAAPPGPKRERKAGGPAALPPGQLAPANWPFVIQYGQSSNGSRPPAGAFAYPFATQSSPTFSYSRFTAAHAMRNAASSWRGSWAWAAWA